MRDEDAGRLRYLGHDRAAARYTIRTLDGHERRYDTAGMWAWMRGRDLGGELGPVDPAAARRHPAEAPELTGMLCVLVNPTLGDQCRTAIKAAMAAEGLNATDLAARTGRTRNAVRVALRWGDTAKLSLKMAETMMRAAGGGWRVQYAPYDGEPGQGEPAPLAAAGAAGAAGVIPEPPGVTRMRAVSLCHLAGVAELVSPTEPNDAYRAGSFVIRAGVDAKRVQADVVVPWLTGLADARDPRTAAALTP
jgi:hypothetical protein